MFSMFDTDSILANEKAHADKLKFTNTTRNLIGD